MEQTQPHNTHNFILENLLQGKTNKLVSITTNLLSTLLTNFYNNDLLDHNRSSVNSLYCTSQPYKYMHHTILLCYKYTYPYITSYLQIQHSNSWPHNQLQLTTSLMVIHNFLKTLSYFVTIDLIGSTLVDFQSIFLSSKYSSNSFMLYAHQIFVDQLTIIVGHSTKLPQFVNFNSS